MFFNNHTENTPIILIIDVILLFFNCFLIVFLKASLLLIIMQNGFLFNKLEIKKYDLMINNKMLVVSEYFNVDFKMGYLKIKYILYLLLISLKIAIL